MDRIVLLPHEYFQANEAQALEVVVPEDVSTPLQNISSGFFWSVGAAAFAVLAYVLVKRRR
jgi:hypothetical protein